jgi:hypothetical protein
MYPPPNELYSAFSFLGFVLCAIPFYWHFKGKRATIQYSPDSSILSENDNVLARNTGTCLFMIWTGLGCLMQCINSIVWNKNMVNRAPVYCDICNSLDALSLERSFTLRHPQQPVFKSRSMLQYRLLHFASIACSIGLLG